jgi:hypothetical protein
MSIASSPKALFPTLGSARRSSVAASGTINSGGTYLQVPPGATKLKVTCLVGTVGSTPTHALSANQATSTAGAGSKACAGITGTFGTVAGTTAQFDFDLPDVMDIANGFNCLQLVITNNSGSASLMGAEFETGPGPYLA